LKFGQGRTFNRKGAQGTQKKKMNVSCQNISDRGLWPQPKKEIKRRVAKRVKDHREMRINCIEVSVVQLRVLRASALKNRLEGVNEKPPRMQVKG